MLLVVLGVVVALAFSTPAGGEGFEPYHPANEQLRRTSREVWERQTFRPPPLLEERVREAFRSIGEVEGRTDPRLAGLLSTRLKDAWTELERSRAVGALGYTEFDEGRFQAAEVKFQEVLSQFLGPRAPFPAESYQAAFQALADTQALSREARRAVPGMSSDDVLLTRQKRHKLLLEVPKEEGFTPR